MVLARIVVLTHGSLEDKAQNSPVFQKSNKRSNLTSVLTCNLIFCITLGLIDPMSDQSVPELAIAIFCVCICIFILICICICWPSDCRLVQAAIQYIRWPAVNFCQQWSNKLGIN